MTMPLGLGNKAPGSMGSSRGHNSAVYPVIVRKVSFPRASSFLCNLNVSPVSIAVPLCQVAGVCGRVCSSVVMGSLRVQGLVAGWDPWLPITLPCFLS